MRERELIIDGIKVAYLERSFDDSMPFFVFLHGWGGNMTNFTNIYDAFADINILAMDFPGFGHSAKLKKPFTLEQYSNITKDFIEKKLHNKKIILVGHSFGGRVMMQLLADKNRLLKQTQKYIFIGTPFYREKIGLIKKMIGVIAKALNVVTMLPLVSKLRKPLRKVLYTAIGATDYLELGEDAVMRKTFQNTINNDISKYLKYIKRRKTVLIWGDQDKTVPLSVAERVANDVGLKLHIIDNAGHMPFIDNKDGFIKTFNDILEK